MRIPPGAIMLTAALVLGACSGSGLRQLSTPGAGPDEFLILPNKPLTAPADYDTLPTPTPGGANLVDQNPTQDAILALGGRGETAGNTGVPAADGLLVSQASRYGVPADTRAVLAEADAKFRKRKAVLSNFRLFKVDRYEQAYDRQKIDPFTQTGRFRGAGVATPSAPPRNN